jgi:tetratricopeptide (TPR) repeat protein
MSWIVHVPRLGAALFASALLAIALGACAPQEAPKAALPAPVATALASLQTASDDPSADRAAQVVLAYWAHSGSATVDFLVLRADKAAGGGDMVTAKQLLDEAVGLAPTFAEAYARRSSLAFQRQDYPAALADLRAASELEPRHFVVWTALGAVFEALNRPADALRAYRAGLAVHPRFEPARQGEARMARLVEGVET